MKSTHNQEVIPMPDFLSGGGEMEGLIRSFNWSKTALGPIDTWSPYLKAAINIILHSPVPMVIVWGQKGYLIYNDAYSVFAGKKHPQVLGADMVEAWPEVADFNRNMLNIVLSGKKLSYENQNLILYRNNVPEEVWLNLNYSPIIDESGKPAGALAIVVETTQAVLARHKQKVAEEELKHERQRLFDLFMNAPAGIAILTGPNLVFQLANDPYLQLVRKDGSIVGKPLLDVLPGLEPGLFEIIKKVSFKGESFKANELPVVLDWDNNGKVYPRFLNFIYEPVFENGKPNGLVAFVIDVTEQVKSRKSVEEQNKVLEMITSGASLGDALNFLIRSIEVQANHEMIGSILLLDQDGKHLRHGAAPSLPKEYNEAIDGIRIGPDVGSCGTCAYSKKEVIVSDISTDPLWENFKGLALSHNLQACWSTPIISGEKVLGTFAMYYPKPHTPTQEERKIVEYVIRTATLAIERKLADESLTEKNKELVKINNDLDNFIYTASHDLKAPVSNIEGLIYTLKDCLHQEYPTIKEETGTLLQLIDVSISRFRNTIQDLTEITKVQKSQEEDVKHILCDQVIEDVKLMILDKITESKAIIDIDVKNGNSVKFSKKNFTSIVYNLLSNAIKYRQPERQLKILVQMNKENEYTVLTVKDNGLGISNSNRSKLFGMFKRFHDHTEGSGIGLYIVKRIVDNAGGKIEVDSEVDKGTTFRIYFRQ